MIFLDTSKTLARIGEALPPGHRLIALAAELAAADAGEMSGAAGKLLHERKIAPGQGGINDQDGEIGVLGAAMTAGDHDASWAGRPLSFLLWVDPGVASGRRQGGEAGTVSPEPNPGYRQLVLYPPKGRYRVEYWDVGERRLVGVEIGTAAPLVLGLPNPRVPLIILIVSLF